MPGATEYLHLLQGALDEIGLRYQVIDTNGSMREWLQWPVQLSAVSSWQPIPDGVAPALPKPSGWDARPGTQHALAFDFRGTLGADRGEDQTLVSAWDDNEGPHILWVGLSDVDHRLETAHGSQGRRWRSRLARSLARHRRTACTAAAYPHWHGTWRCDVSHPRGCPLDLVDNIVLTRSGSHDVARTLGRRQWHERS
jgi:hypothetical protein